MYIASVCACLYSDVKKILIRGTLFSSEYCYYVFVKHRKLTEKKTFSALFSINIIITLSFIIIYIIQQ